MRWLHDLLPPPEAEFLLRSARALARTSLSSELTYGNRSLPILGWPLVLSPRETALLARLSSCVLQGLEAFTRRTIRSRALGNAGLSPLQREFVRMDPGYSRSVPIARIDAYWTPRGPQFLEVNTDGTAYVDYTDRLNNTVLNLLGPFLRSLKNRSEPFSIREALYKTLLTSYREFCRTSGLEPKARPRITIMDYRGVKTRQDQENIARFFLQRGLPCFRVDPRELRFHAGRLRHRGVAIDIVYRRATSREIFDRPQDFGAFLAAYRARAVCTVGSFRSDLGFHKASPAWALGALPWKSRMELERLIPPTLVGPTADRALSARLSFLYKPSNRNQGKGIRLGSQVRPSEWSALVRRARRGEGAIQKLVEPPTVRIPAELGLERYGDLRLNLGIFVIGGRMAGLCARLTPDLILREKSPEWMIPVYSLRTQAGAGALSSSGLRRRSSP